MYLVAGSKLKLEAGGFKVEMKWTYNHSRVSRVKRISDWAIPKRELIEVFFVGRIDSCT